MITKFYLIVLAACSTPAPYPYLQAPPVDADSITINDAPPAYPLWSGANKILATAWCGLELRCGGGQYALEYGSGAAAAEACEQTNADALCYGEWEGFAQCEGIYPQKQLADLVIPSKTVSWQSHSSFVECTVASSRSPVVRSA